MSRGSLDADQQSYWTADDIRYQEPVLTRASDQPAEGQPADTERAHMSILFKPGDLVEEPPTAVLSVKLPDEFFQLTYKMRGPEQDAMRGVVDQIREQYARQAAIADRLEGRPEQVPIHADDTKASTPSLSNQISELLRCQEYIDLAALFEETTERDERQDMKLTSLLEQLNDWYVNGIGAIRDQLRTKREGLRFVRELIRSGSEILIDLGIRLAREPSIRAAVQRDLAEVYHNNGLPAPIRQRAFSYLDRGP